MTKEKVNINAPQEIVSFLYWLDNKPFSRGVYVFMMGAVYCIINFANNKFYIGSTKHPLIREKEHFNSLKRGAHKNRYLQNGFNKYGEENFIFLIVEENIKEKELTVKEKRYIFLLTPEYNLTKVRGSKFTHIKSIELKRQIAIRQTGENNSFFGKTHSDEFKERQSNRMKGEKNPMFGRTHTIETRQKLSQVNLTPEALERLTQMTKNRKVSPTQIERLRQRSIKSILQYDKDMNFIKEWESIVLASKTLRINKCGISNCINHHTRSAGGFVWILKNE